MTSYVTKAPNFWLLLLAVYCSGFNGLRISASLTLSDAILASVGLLWVVLAGLRRHAKVDLVVVISLVLFLAVLIAAVIAGTSRMGAESDIEVFLKVLVTFYALPYLILDTCKSERRIRLVVEAYVYSAITNIIVALMDGLHLTDFQHWLHVETVNGFSYPGRFVGLTMHPNHMGQQCALAAALAIAAAPYGKLSNRRMLWGIGLWAVLLFGVIGSGSRGSLLALVIVFSGILVLYLKSIQPRKLLGIVSVLLVVLGLYWMVNESVRFDSAVSRLVYSVAGVKVSDALREAHYIEAWRDFLTSPLVGVGFSFIGGVENVYLQFLQAGGALGLIGLLLYIAGPFRYVWKAVVSGDRERLLIGPASAVAVFALTSLTQNMVYARFTLVPMGILWAVIRVRRLNFRSKKSMGNGINNVGRGGWQSVVGNRGGEPKTSEETCPVASREPKDRFWSRLTRDTVSTREAVGFLKAQ